ncbi:helix-turn-helix domain-containing protein [Actinophytocola glycyrrhizae]|uniref:Helix-turn-helix domain-containing protein n=1 Tax=Actinophytocola glycyrrhizae TaxID=2044873 RepID=A0ABV9S405_9PSEU
MADNALGRFLRARRDATAPAAVGLTAGPRRRAPGLRRAELAERARISVEYLTRLERGSDRYPSGQVLGSLADALALTADERVHLYRLIKADSGAQCQAAGAAPVLRPTVRALLDRLGATPAYVADPAGDVLACSDGFRSLADPAGLLDEERPNLARYVFADARSRAVFPDWAEIAGHWAAAVRAAADLGDLAAGALAVELSITAGTEFGDRYAAAATLPAQTGFERWSVRSQTLRLAYETLALPGIEEHRLVVYLPA